MDKKKISKKQSPSSVPYEIIFVQPKKGVKVTRWIPSKVLLDEKQISLALYQSLKDGDIKSFKEILSAHLAAKIKSKAAKKNGLSNRTMFDALSAEGNPRLKTISKLVQMAFAT
ncbi:MAG TPA: hypothetical protein PLJ21_07765 [Pseudobdellovibrionaceae bacterium]|nr:hypothetical protein [Pseudobdellovibrionaceae bacterium]